MRPHLSRERSSGIGVLNLESEVNKDLVVEEQDLVCLRSLSDFLFDYRDSKPMPRGRGGIKFLSLGASTNRSIVSSLP